MQLVAEGFIKRMVRHANEPQDRLGLGDSYHTSRREAQYFPAINGK